jgi:hypothetical protein
MPSRFPTVWVRPSPTTVVTPLAPATVPHVMASYAAGGLVAALHAGVQHGTQPPSGGCGVLPSGGEPIAQVSRWQQRQLPTGVCCGGSLGFRACVTDEHVVFAAFGGMQGWRMVKLSERVFVFVYGSGGGAPEARNRQASDFDQLIEVNGAPSSMP